RRVGRRTPPENRARGADPPPQRTTHAAARYEGNGVRADISGGTSSLLDAGNYDLHWLFTVENGSGTAVDLSGRLQYVRLTLPSPDQPIGALSVELLREPNDDGSQSLAPLMGA